MNILFLASFFGYISILIFIGWIVSRRQKNSVDFMVGDQSINYWVTAVATQATDMSAWLFMSFPAIIYSTGLIGCWSAIGLVICMFLNWHFIAKKLRQATEHYQAFTLSSYFEKRFNDSSGALRIISASLALFFFTLYIAAGIVALGRALGATFGFSYFVGITLGTLTVAIYTILGGFIAVAWNDFLQGMFVLLIIVFLPIYALKVIGGFGAISSAALTKNISLALIPDWSFAAIAAATIPGFGWGLGIFGQPHILVNFMGIDNPDEIRKAKYVGISWQLLTLSAATLIGLIGIPFFTETLVKNELVFINMVKMLFDPFVAGLILCAILAAAISTMDSQILVSASMLTEDIYKKIFHKKATPQQLLTISRIAGVLMIGFSFTLAIGNNETIWSLIRYAWGGLGSTFGPVLILSLYSKRITKTGALAGIIVGGVTAAVWKHLGLPLADWAIIPGFTLSFCSAILGSIVWRR